MRSANFIAKIDRNANVFLAFILFAGFALRLYTAFFAGLPHMHRDSIDYFQQADTLLAGGYTNYFPNGYPFIIAGMKAIGGNQALNILLALNLVLAVFTIYFVYDIGKRVFNIQMVGLLAALIIAILPTQINYVRWLTSEVPSEFFLTGAYFFYFRQRKLLGGIFLGIVIVIRTELLPLLVLLLALEAIWLKKISWRLLAGSMAPILFIAIYCYGKTGDFSIAGHGRVNIMYSVTAKGNYVDWYFVDKHPEINTTGKAVKMYMDTIKANPGSFVKERFVNMWNLWGFYPDSSAGSRSVLSRLTIGISNFFMIVFGLFAWWKNRRKFNVFILIFPFIIVTGVHIFFLALPRYTYPVEPFMVLLASWTLAILFHGLPASEPASTSSTLNKRKSQPV